MLEKLHLVKLVTGLGEDEAAPGHDVLGGEADHGHRLLMMEGGHPGLGGPGLVTITGQQLGAQAEAGDHSNGQAPDQGQPPPPTGQGWEHHQDAAVIVPVVSSLLSLLTLSYFLTGPWLLKTGASVSQDTHNHRTPGPGSHR